MMSTDFSSVIAANHGCLHQAAYHVCKPLSRSVEPPCRTEFPLLSLLAGIKNCLRVGIGRERGRRGEGEEGRGGGERGGRGGGGTCASSVDIKDSRGQGPIYLPLLQMLDMGQPNPLCRDIILQAQRNTTAPHIHFERKLVSQAVVHGLVCGDDRGVQGPLLGQSIG